MYSQWLPSDRTIAPPYHSEPLGVQDPPTRSTYYADRDRSVRQIKPLYVRTANKPKLLMGPRRPNTASALGSVMDRVRMLEGRDLTG